MRSKNADNQMSYKNHGSQMPKIGCFFFNAFKKETPQYSDEKKACPRNAYNINGLNIIIKNNKAKKRH